MDINTLRILGCGSSGGVPLITGNWGDCNPNNPRNRRMRSSVLIQSGGKNILIDASPDVRAQLLDARISSIDAVIITHAHADHCHGMDELRHFFIQNQTPIPLFSDGKTLQTLKHRFGYMFTTQHAIYPAHFEAYEVTPNRSIDHGVLKALPYPILPFYQDHGPSQTLGIRMGNIAYSTDVKGFPGESLPYLCNLDLWVVDCLRYHEHPSHAHFELTRTWIETYQPKRALLTHMSEFLDEQDLSQKCAEITCSDVRPAYDGMCVLF